MASAQRMALREDHNPYEYVSREVCDSMSIRTIRVDRSVRSLLSDSATVTGTISVEYEFRDDASVSRVEFKDNNGHYPQSPVCKSTYAYDHQRNLAGWQTWTITGADTILYDQVDIENQYDRGHTSSSRETTRIGGKKIGKRNTEYMYDDHGRLQLIECHSSYRGMKSHYREEYTYDSLGRLKEMFGDYPSSPVRYNWAYDDVGRLASKTVLYDGKSHRSTYEYTHQLLTAVKHDFGSLSLDYISTLDGSDSLLVYDDHMQLQKIVIGINSIHGNGSRIEYEYDENGRCVVEREYAAYDATTPVRTIRRAYDTKGLLIEVETDEDDMGERWYVDKIFYTYFEE